MIIEGKKQQTVVQDGGRFLLVVATPEMKLTRPGLRTKECCYVFWGANATYCFIGQSWKREYRGNVLGFFVFATCKMLVNGLYFGIDQ